MRQRARYCNVRVRQAGRTEGVVAAHLVHVVTRDTSHDTSRAEVMARLAEHRPLYNNCYNERVESGECEPSLSQSQSSASKMSRMQEPLGPSLPVTLGLFTRLRLESTAGWVEGEG